MTIRGRCVYFNELISDIYGTIMVMRILKRYMHSGSTIQAVSVVTI